MLTGRTIARINNRPRRVIRLPLVAIGGGALALAALLYAPLALPVLALAALLVGALLIFGVYRVQKAKTITSLSYKGRLDEEASARFSEVSEALEALASSQKVWRLTGTTGTAGRTRKVAEAAPTPQREPARVGLLKTPGIRVDVPIWGIEAGEQSILFFPEGALLYKNDRYEPLPYDLLKVAISSAPFYEKEEVPEDVKVVAEPTERSRMPIVLYTLLEIGLPRGREAGLLVSSREAGARFARAFGVESRKSPRKWGQEQEDSQGFSQEESSQESGGEGAGSTGGAHRDPRIVTEGTRMASAYAILGVARGASAEQIAAAYRKLARAHHPDKVANESREIREASERRMKEINAAYALLKRGGNGSAEGARVG